MTQVAEKLVEDPASMPIPCRTVRELREASDAQFKRWGIPSMVVETIREVLREANILNESHSPLSVVRDSRLSAAILNVWEF